MTPAKFSARDGPFVRTLEDALKHCGVDKEAYHGGSFVGNHVHECLKVCCKLYKDLHACICAYHNTLQLGTVLIYIKHKRNSLSKGNL